MDANVECIILKSSFGDCFDEPCQRLSFPFSGSSNPKIGLRLTNCAFQEHDFKL
jgi:hypothetical protein